MSADTAYWYKVAALNAGGTRPESPEAHVAAVPNSTTPPAPLTATFTNVPGGHGGTGTTFKVRLEFIEPVKTSYRTLRDSAVVATNGVVRRAKRVSGVSPADEWDITVSPLSNNSVTVRLTPANVECGQSGAICATDGRKLSSGASVEVLHSGISGWLERHGRAD